MGKLNADIYRFNAGLISDLAQMRRDLKRLAVSASVQTNWMPRSLGSMSIRCGTEKIETTANNTKTNNVPFKFSATDQAIIEFSATNMCVRVNEVLITRPSVSSAVTNGTFTSNITGWTDADESGAASVWATGGYLSLTGTKFNRAIVTQQVTVAAGDQNKVHALRIKVYRHGVFFRIGSSDKGEQYLSETRLGEGEHSIAFTPTGNFHIYIANETAYAALVDSVIVESSGIMKIDTPFVEEDLGLIRYDQSGDVVYIACDGYAQYKVERRAAESWSFVKYLPIDGPFRSINTGYKTITPSARTGSITLTASHSLFKSTHVGSYWRILSFGQSQAAELAGVAQTSDSVKITGTGSQRIFAYSIAGTWVGTVQLQRSVGEEGAWETIASYTGNISTPSYDDGFDNQEIFYRLYMSAYTSGTASVNLTYSGGITKGVVRIKAYSSGTSVTADVIESLGKTTATTDWYEGQWSDYRGYPTACRLAEGRLWWVGRDQIVGSISDAFESFDDSLEGDSAPINRTLGSGPVDSIKWILDLQRLAVGGEEAEHFFFSTSLDEPLTPTSLNRRSPTTQGSSSVGAVKLDNSGIYVQRSGTRLNILQYDASSYQYVNDELTKYYPEAGEPSIVKIAVQMQPDKRIHCLRSDGTAFILIYSKIDDVNCIVEMETDGDIEDIVIQSAALEDRVYYTIKRTIDGTDYYYLERVALEYECSQPSYIYNGSSATVISDLPYPNGFVVTARDASGDKIGNYTVSDYSITLGSAVTYAKIDPAVLKLADCGTHYSGAATDTITGADYLEGKEVVVWGDGKYQGTFTVSGGGFTLDEEVEECFYGLKYTAPYKSVKLSYGSDMGTGFGLTKTIYGFAPILKNAHAQGLKYGPTFEELDDMPLVEDGAEVDQNLIWDTYEKPPIEFDSDYGEDPRICFQAEAPFPCTVLGVVMNIEAFE